jgi:L-fuculose-phosphate aldolase
MVECSRQLAARGLIAGQDGDLSVRLSPNRVLVTPAGLIKSLLKPSDIVEVDEAGRRRRGRPQPYERIGLTFADSAATAR